MEEEFEDLEIYERFIYELKRNKGLVQRLYKKSIQVSEMGFDEEAENFITARRRIYGANEFLGASLNCAAYIARECVERIMRVRKVTGIKLPPRLVIPFLDIFRRCLKYDIDGIVEDPEKREQWYCLALDLDKNEANGRVSHMLKGELERLAEK
mgnify:CR=1 FL=1